MAKKEEKKKSRTWIIIGVIVLVVIIWFSWTGSVRTEYNARIQTYNNDVNVLNNLVSKYNSANSFDERVNYAGQFANEYSVRSAHFDDFYNYISSHNSAINMIGVNAYAMQKQIMDAKKGYENVGSAMKSQIEAEAQQRNQAVNILAQLAMLFI